MPRRATERIRPGASSRAPADNATSVRPEELLEGPEDLEAAEEELREQPLELGVPGLLAQAHAERLRVLRAAELALDLHYRSFRTAAPAAPVQDTGSKGFPDAPLLPLTDVFSDGPSTGCSGAVLQHWPGRQCALCRGSRAL